MPTLNNPFPADSRLYDIAETLLSRPAPPLVPEAPWNQETAKAIEQATAAENASLFVTAALHLLNDDLDRAHRLVQAQEGDQTADYLHMLVHRREGDWSNTGYWVRRTGEHPVYAALVSAIQTEPGVLPLFRTEVGGTRRLWWIFAARQRRENRTRRPPCLSPNCPPVR